jgi:hypothetical protein
MAIGPTSGGDDGGDDVKWKTLAKFPFRVRKASSRRRLAPA